MSLLFLCLFRFFSRSLCVSPATYYVGPCGEFKMPGVTAGKGKESWHFQTVFSYFIQQSVGGGFFVVVCLFAE